MMLLVGLGNPGALYSSNRHNVGFKIIDQVAQHYVVGDFKRIPGVVDFSPLKLKNGITLLLAKPQTFMNLSGRAVSYLMSLYKISPDNVYVLHDDVDLTVRRVKIKKGGGSGGHNGIKHIDEMIGRDYWRIRVGVGRPDDARMQMAAHVLSNFPLEEQELMNEIYIKIAANIPDIVMSRKVQELDLDKLSAQEGA